MALADEQTDLHALNTFSSSIDEVSFKKYSMSLGLVVLEKLFTRTRMSTPQSDNIKMLFKVKQYVCFYKLHILCHTYYTKNF